MAIYEANAAQSQLTSLIAPGRLEEWNHMNRSFDAIAGSYSENMTDTAGDPAGAGSWTWRSWKPPPFSKSSTINPLWMSDFAARPTRRTADL